LSLAVDFSPSYTLVIRSDLKPIDECLVEDVVINPNNTPIGGTVQAQASKDVSNTLASSRNAPKAKSPSSK
jgi:hypothetical protein